MTTYYVNSAATGTGDGSSPTNAATSLGGLLANLGGAGGAVGGEVLVLGSHVEPVATANITMVGSGTATAPMRIRCVSDFTSGADASGLVIGTKSASYSLAFYGYAYARGITFASGANTSGGGNITVGAGAYWTIESGGLQLASTNASARLILGANSNTSFGLTLLNSILTYGAAQLINIYSGYFKMRGGALAGSAPSGLIYPSGTSGEVEIIGADLSLVASGKYLIGSGANNLKALFQDCKVSAGVLLSAVTPGVASRVIAVRCSDTSNNPFESSMDILGTQSVDTSCVLSGGATDQHKARSRLITTLASTVSPVAVAYPFTSDVVLVWNETIGSSVSVAFEAGWDQSGLPNNNDVWLEAEYLADTGDLLGVFTAAPFGAIAAAPTAYAASSATWINPPATFTKFQIGTSFTAKQAGVVVLRVKVAKPGVNVHVDLKPIIAGVSPSRIYTTPSGATVAETAALTQGATTNLFIPMVRRGRS